MLRLVLRLQHVYVEVAENFSELMKLWHSLNCVLHRYVASICIKTNVWNTLITLILVHELSVFFLYIPVNFHIGCNKKCIIIFIVILQPCLFQNSHSSITFQSWCLFFHTLFFFCFSFCLHLCRNPVEKRPGSALKQQRRDSGRQNRGAGPGGQDQANLKLERIRDTRNCRGAFVRLCGVSESHSSELWSNISVSSLFEKLHRLKVTKGHKSHDSTII